MIVQAQPVAVVLDDAAAMLGVSRTTSTVTSAPTSASS